MMNDRYYGIDLSAKNGAGWYSSRPVVEVIARCIYAENNYPERKDDRIAISAVILNSMVSNNRTGYQEVTLQGRYATINDGGKGSNEAVSGKNKSDPVWQQATLLACIVYYGRSRNDITYFYSIPKGISTQEYFRAFSSITLTYNNGARLNGATRSNVAIAGYGTINNQNDVRTVNNYDKSRYNIFYNY